MTKQTNVSIRKIDNGWIYSIVEFDPTGGMIPTSQEHYADTLENVFDQLRRKVGDQNLPQTTARKPIPYPLSGTGSTAPWTTWSFAGFDHSCSFGPDKENDFFFDPRTGTVAGERTEEERKVDHIIGQALCNVWGFCQDKPKEPDVLSSFKEVWTEKK